MGQLTLDLGMTLGDAVTPGALFGNPLLLEDGTDALLLEDGVSELLLET